MRYDAEAVGAARSLLFVPGNRPERFAKAAGAQPDIVLIDLEDAVSEADKQAARAHAADWLSDGHPAMVRINAADTPWHEDDLLLVADHSVPVMLAKAERPEQIQRIAEVAPGVPVIPLVETAGGLVAIHQLCAESAVTRLAFGSIDLANQLGVDPDDREALAAHRSTLVLASAAAGLAPPIDGVTTSLRESDTLTSDVTYALRMGMTAKLCIHPMQVAAVHAATEPSDAEVQWAATVVSAAERAQGSAVAVDGKMIDVPVVERARRILARSAQGAAGRQVLGQ